MKLLVLVPAHNEAANLTRVVEDLRQHWPSVPALVVDDGSTDDTANMVRTLNVLSLRLGRRLGLGRALRAGLRYARTLGYDLVVRFDGDGQHRADQIASLVEPILSGSVDVVIGSRFIDQPAGAHGGVRHRSRRALATCLSLITGRPVTDPTSGFWAFGPRAVEVLSQHHPGGYPEPELLLFLHRNGFRVAEVTIAMRERLAGSTSLTLPRTGVALARTALALVVVPLRRSIVELRS